MPLHPTIARALADMSPPPPGPPDPAALRAVEAARLPPPESRRPPHAVEDRTLDGAAGPVPLRLYRPSAAAALPVLVHLRGGASVLGFLDRHDHVARELAQAARVLVVSVGCRLAPEHRFPAGLLDCLGVVRWIAERGVAPADGIGWDRRRSRSRATARAAISRLRSPASRRTRS